ncbi:MAG: LCCL domain-containing protein [Clostridia bacterium]|nr:LCCL domain-containing protein [Clostridia bacterium]
MRFRAPALIAFLLAACLTLGSPVLSAEGSRDPHSLVELDQIIQKLETSISTAIQEALAHPTFIAELQSLLASLKGNRQLIAGELGVAEPETIISVPFAPENLWFYRDKTGETFNFCVKGASSGRVWGNEVYTCDSSLAAAAVHVGALRAGECGVVAVAILPGQSSYKGSSANGINTWSYGSYSGSYRVSRNTSKGIYVLPDPGGLTWFRNGGEGVFYFRVTGTAGGSVWGTDVYTDDSLLAAAAVHSRFLKVGETAIVGVMFLPGQDKYVGSTRNGVRSFDFCEYGGSYRIVRVLPDK